MKAPKLKGHDKSGTRGKRSRYATTVCSIHGSQEKGMVTGYKTVKVAIPTTKRERMAGCPLCRREKNMAAVAKEAGEV